MKKFISIAQSSDSKYRAEFNTREEAVIDAQYQAFTWNTPMIVAEIVGGPYER